MKRYYSIIEKWLDDNLQDKKGSSYRLPRSLIPSTYSLELLPDIYGADPSKFTFSGTVKIVVSCNEDTNNITLNSKKLTINEKSVKILSLSTGSNMVNPEFQSLSYDEELQLVTFITRNQVIKGHNYSIEMKFTGPLLDDLQGLYYSSYKEENITRYHFRNVHAYSCILVIKINRFLHESLLKIWDFFHKCEKFRLFTSGV